jgi:glycosyltransferase involved in cell wall biosynthesis
MVAPRAPYPTIDGASQRNLQILRWLAERHDVTLVAFGDPDDATARCGLGRAASGALIIPPPRRDLRTRLVDLLLTSRPDLTRRLWSRAMVRAIRRAFRDGPYDLVQVEGLEMFETWVAAGISGGRPPRVVLDEHNAEYALQASAASASRANGSSIGGVYSTIQAARLARYEANAFGLVDGVVAVSTEDEKALRALRLDVRTSVVPNGVDTASIVPVMRREAEARALFIGKLDYRPNVDAVEWLAREIWPLVRRYLPAATLDVVGRDPTASIERLNGSAGVNVVGEVPDDRIWFQRASLLVVPMRMGSGVRLKVLQAMATGTPIVSTSLGMAGTGAVDGMHYLRGDTPAELASALVTALRDRELCSRLATSSLDLVRSGFDWRVILPRLDAFHREIVEHA